MTLLARLRKTAAVAAVSLLAGPPAVAQALANGDVLSALEGFRYGVSVTDLDGNVLIAHRADERFMPASNAKLLVTAAALAAEADLSALDYGLQLVLEPAEAGPPTLVLVGRGDPTVGAGPECEARCLETLAAAVAEAGLSEVGDIVADDRWFADERRPLGWSWDDLKFGHGTSISAIAVNDNVRPLKVTPAMEEGAQLDASWAGEDAGYFVVANEAFTSAAGTPRALRLERRLGDRTARLYGELPAKSRSLTLDLGVDDPAHLAAWSFKQVLEAEGIVVSGNLRTRHRPLRYTDEPQLVDPSDPDSEMRCLETQALPPEGSVIATLDPAPLREIVGETNRESQNLYAEVLLRQLGRAAGTGSSFCGLLQVTRFLEEEVGVEASGFHVADGSGLSSYNRVTPAAMTALLRHAAAAPWGEAFKASLPVGGGAEGTLRYRFRGTRLDGKVFAKTGTLNHVDALSGYLEADSGEVLAFSIIVNDRPLDSPSARREIDTTLLKIAGAY